MKLKSKMKLICLTALILTSCAYNAKKLTPAFLDVPKGTCRIYYVIQTEPTVEFALKEEVPILQCNGFLALPVDQAMDIKRHYEESRHGKSDTTTPTVPDPEPKSELEILNGVHLDSTAEAIEFK